MSKEGQQHDRHPIQYRELGARTHPVPARWYCPHRLEVTLQAIAFLSQQHANGALLIKPST